MKRIPRVAIWLVVRAHENRLEETVKSVFKQTFKNYNLYVAVRTEDEKQWEQVCSYAAQDARIQVVCYENEKQTDTIAMAACRLKEEYLAFLECGDEWQADKLQKQLDYLYAHPESAACFTQVALSSCDTGEESKAEAPAGNADSPAKIGWIQAFLDGEARLWTSSALIRREMYCHPRFCSAGSFTLPTQWAWLHICKKAEIGMLPQALTHLYPKPHVAETSYAYPPLVAVLQELNADLSEAEFAAIFSEPGFIASAHSLTKLELVERFFNTHPQSPYKAELEHCKAEIAAVLEQEKRQEDTLAQTVPHPLKKNDVIKQVEVACFLSPDKKGAAEQCSKQTVALDDSGSFHAKLSLPYAGKGLLRISTGDLPCRVSGILVKNQLGQTLRLEQTLEKRSADGRSTFSSKAFHIRLANSPTNAEIVHVFGCIQLLFEDVCQTLVESQKSLQQQKEAAIENKLTLEEKEERISSYEIRLADQQKHIAELERTQAEIVNSFFWRATWPARAGVGYIRKFCTTMPVLRTAYRVAACLKDNGWAVTSEMCKDDLYYYKRFPGKAMPACRFVSRAFLRKQASTAVQGPKISILVPLYHTPLDYLQEMVDSVRNQTYPNWELCLADAGLDDASANYLREIVKKEPRIRLKQLAQNLGISENTNAAMEVATGEYFALLDHDDLLHPSALWYVVKEIANGADFIYTDELTFEDDISNVKNYTFKPDFAPEMLRSCNYICHLSAFSRNLLARAGGGFRSEYDGSQDYDMILRLTEQASKIAHVPHLLYYWRASATSVASNISAKQYCIDAAIAALQAHLERVQRKGKVSLIPNTPGFYKIDYALCAEPLVSIIIPSCDHIADLDKCISSICEKTSYPNYEILIIENNSHEEETFAYYKKLSRCEHIRVLYYPEYELFNYSRLNNFGVRYAKGEILLLLNNDVEVLSRHWLEEMLMYAQQPEIGAVGAMLYYPDDTVQHAGVGIGIGGIAGHLHKYFARNSHGYMGRMHYAQNVGAVTGACLMLRREVYDQTHGLNEEFAVAFNDVDLCMRIRSAGYRIVFTPYAELYHYESKSRGAETTPEKQQRFLSEIRLFEKYWQQQLDAGDPYYNINLSRYSEKFELAVQPLQEN